MKHENEYESNIKDELDTKNEAFLSHCRLYDSNYKKSENKISIKEILLRVKNNYFIIKNSVITK